MDEIQARYAELKLVLCRLYDKRTAQFPFSSWTMDNSEPVLFSPSALLFPASLHEIINDKRLAIKHNLFDIILEVFFPVKILYFFM